MARPSKLAIVTGASTGIGLELALALAPYYLVLATMRKPEQASPRLLSVANVRVHALDVTDQESVDNLYAAVREKYRRKVSLLINNAGYGVAGSIEAVSVERAKELFEVNVWGVMRMCQGVLEVMKGGGLIVMVSSTGGIRGFPAGDVYCMSKFALQGMAESFRYSVAHSNVKVLCVNPGPVRTPFIDRWKEEEGGREAESTSHAKKLQGVARDTLMKRMESREGQSAEECALEILKVILREQDKDLRKGDSVSFINGTSEPARALISSILRDPTASNGEVYSRLWAMTAQDILRERES